jgi:hypothetical protein
MCSKSGLGRRTTIIVQGEKRVKFQIENGATCRVLSSRDVPQGTATEPTDRMLSMYNRSKLRPRGKFEVSLQNLKNKKYKGRSHFLIKISCLFYESEQFSKWPL